MGLSGREAQSFQHKHSNISYPSLTTEWPWHMATVMRDGPISPSSPLRFSLLSLATYPAVRLMGKLGCKVPEARD
ncbi:hypothetical protein PAXRUDRAFT_835835 [Paxillus rubicundulus Ve08.2h10]|uniref:Uncharacterized protein n=1 Tax=Paxillus rubicundulus Ve08.2h10 TaxID=930991 RepID=A0A0D0CIK9_9AGAM|nr:hypothetical protein PAXRUDRAFT_835835 [Paxillus rubicundulus Ve08.2h10]